MNNRIFDIVQGQVLTLRKTGTPIPESEPTFILRARDRKALSTIRVYQSTMRPLSEGWKIIQAVINDFTEFKQKNPKKMGKSSEVY